jgi:hypothetical protein
MFRLVFILYCFEAGILLLFVPWFPFWDRTLIQIPFDALRHFCLHPLARSAVSGFGLVHLIWALHDVVLFLRRRTSPADAEAPTVRGS